MIRYAKVSIQAIYCHTIQSPRGWGRKLICTSFLDEWSPQLRFKPRISHMISECSIFLYMNMTVYKTFVYCLAIMFSFTCARVCHKDLNQICGRWPHPYFQFVKLELVVCCRLIFGVHYILHIYQVCGIFYLPWYQYLDTSELSVAWNNARLSAVLHQLSCQEVIGRPLGIDLSE